MADHRYEPEAVHVVWIVRILVGLLGMLAIALGIAAVLLRLHASNLPVIESFAAFCKGLVASGEPVLQTDPTADLVALQEKQRIALEGGPDGATSGPVVLSIDVAMDALAGDGYRLDPNPSPADKTGGALP